MDGRNARAALEAALAEHDGASGTSFLTRFFGMSVEYGEPDTCTVRFGAEDFMHNLHGTLHGGVVAYAFDVCMGRLLRRLGRPGKTIALNIQFQRAVHPGELVCEARLLKQGRSISFVEARLSDASGRLLAAATSTWAH